MLFMVVEKFRNQDGKAVYRKLRDNGRGLPDGLKFVSSYVSADLGRCFQLMETDDMTLFQRWIADWQERGRVRSRARRRRQDDARRAGAAAVKDSTAGYAQEAPALLELYERISSETLHQPVWHLIPTTPSRCSTSAPARAATPRISRRWATGWWPSSRSTRCARAR